MVGTAAQWEAYMNPGTRLAARILGTYAVIYVAYLYIPVLFLPLFSFNDSIYISFPLRGWTCLLYTSPSPRDS